MNESDVKKAERLGYSRGYAAGRRKGQQQQQRVADHAQRERQAFLDRAFLAALPMAMEQNTWSRDGKKINGLRERVRLAWEIAEAGLKERKIA